MWTRDVSGKRDVWGWCSVVGLELKEIQLQPWAEHPTRGHSQMCATFLEPSTLGIFEGLALSSFFHGFLIFIWGTLLQASWKGGGRLTLECPPPVFLRVQLRI